MSEPEPRPSWMPSARLIGAAVSIDSSERAWDSWAPVRTERVDRLLLATGLRAQIEALEGWSECPMTDPDRGSYWADCNDYTVNSKLRSPELCSRCKEIERLRTRLAELEGA